MPAASAEHYRSQSGPCRVSRGLTPSQRGLLWMGERLREREAGETTVQPDGSVVTSRSGVVVDEGAEAKALAALRKEAEAANPRKTEQDEFNEMRSIMKSRAKLLKRHRPEHIRWRFRGRPVSAPRQRSRQRGSGGRPACRSRVRRTSGSRGDPHLADDRPT